MNALLHRAAPPAHRRAWSPLLRAVRSPSAVQQLGVGRAAVGTALLLRPGLVPGLLGVEAATSAHVVWVLQMLGAREVALGLGSVAAARAGGRPALRPWLLAGLFSDAVDALTVGAAVGSGRVRRGSGAALVAVAATAVAVEAAALGRR